MKSKFSALVICFMMSVAAIAATPTSVLVKAATKESVFNIHYSAIEKGNVKVSILDSNEKSVFNEVLTQVTSFVRPYNFSELPEGEYTIVIEDINGKQAEKINYTLNKITSFINVAKVANEGNKYWLNVANNGTDILSVRIYSQDGTQLHEQLVKVTGNLSLIYNLNKVKPGAVRFEVTSGNGKTQTINF